MDYLGNLYLNFIFIYDCQTKKAITQQHKLVMKKIHDKKSIMLRSNQLISIEFKQIQTILQFNLLVNKQNLQEQLELFDFIQNNQKVNQEKITFCLNFNQKYLILFDIWIDQNVILQKPIRQQNEIMRCSIKSMSKLKQFIEKYVKDNKAQNILKNNFWIIKYCIEFHYENQNFSIDLLDYLENANEYAQDFIQFTYIFNTSNPKIGNLKIIIKQILYEKFSTQDELQVTDIKDLITEEFDLSEMLDNLNILELNEQLSVYLQIDSMTNSFIQNFMGVLNINILESCLNMKEPIISIQNTDKSQKWILKPISQECHEPDQTFWDGLYGQLYSSYMSDTLSVEDIQSQLTDILQNMSIDVNTHILVISEGQRTSKIDTLLKLEQNKDKYKSCFTDDKINKNEVFILTDLPQDHLLIQIYSGSVSIAALRHTVYLDLIGLSYDNTCLLTLSGNSWIKLYFQFFSNCQANSLQANYTQRIKMIQQYEIYSSTAYKVLLHNKYREDLYKVIQQSSANLLEASRTINTISLILIQSVNFAEVFDTYNSVLMDDSVLHIKIVCNQQVFMIPIKYQIVSLDEAQKRYPKQYFNIVTSKMLQDQVENDKQLQTFFMILNSSIGITYIDKQYCESQLLVNSHLNSFSLQLVIGQHILASYTKSLEEIALFSNEGFLLCPMYIIMEKDQEYTSNSLYLKFNYSILNSHQQSQNIYKQNIYQLDLIKEYANSDCALLNTNIYEIRIAQVVDEDGRTVYKSLYSDYIDNSQISQMNYFDNIMNIYLKEHQEIDLSLKINRIYYLQNVQQKVLVFDRLYHINSNDTGNEIKRLCLDNYQNVDLQQNQYDILEICFNDSIDGGKQQQVNLKLQIMRQCSNLLENNAGRLQVIINKKNMEDFVNDKNLQFEDYFMISLKSNKMNARSQKHTIQEIFKVQNDAEDYKDEYIIEVQFDNMIQCIQVDDILADDDIMLYFQLFQGSTDILYDFNQINIIELPLMDHKEFNIKRNVLNFIIDLKLKYIALNELESSQLTESEQVNSQAEINVSKSKPVKVNYKEKVKEMKLRINEEMKKQTIIDTNILREQKTLELHAHKYKLIKECLAKRDESNQEMAKNKNQQQMISKTDKELFNQYCSCGQKDPQIMGYCQQCYDNLRKQFEKEIQQYIYKKEEYDQSINQGVSSQIKLRKIKQKIEQIKKLDPVNEINTQEEKDLITQISKNRHLQNQYDNEIQIKKDEIEFYKNLKIQSVQKTENEIKQKNKQLVDLLDVIKNQIEVNEKLKQRDIEQREKLENLYKHKDKKNKPIQKY